MAVYTAVAAEALATFLLAYDLGDLVSAKGIAEGVENTNYLVDTTGGRYILTLYEKRVDPADLPYFLGLMAHLADRGVRAPKPIAGRDGATLRALNGRPASLIEWLPGVSPTEPTPVLTHAAGAALGRMHRALADFAPVRANALGPAGWARLAATCGCALNDVAPGLADTVARELYDLADAWPADLPVATIHADLFPDNVLALGDRVTGVIDFAFACTDLRAYDLAVMHGAWCWSTDGAAFKPERARALLGGYHAAHPLTAEERAALPVLGRGAALRFLLTRAYDWLHTPANALVTRKDPVAYLRRLEHLRAAGAAAFPA